MKHKTMIASALLTLVSSGLFAVEADFGALGAKDKTGLSVEEMLTYAIQDEYLARAEYEAIIDRYGNVRPFSNIIRSEERHISWLRDAFADLEQTLPQDTSASRVVIPADRKTAVEAGVQAEIENIAMYRAFLGGSAAASLPANVRQLFERLAAASESHLRAFRRNLAQRS